MTYPLSLLSPLPECTLPVSSCKLIQKKKKNPHLQLTTTSWKYKHMNMILIHDYFSEN